MKKISPDLASWLLHRNQAQAAKRQRLAGLAKSQASSGKRNRSTGWRTAVIRIPELLAAEDHEKRGALYKIVQSVVHALEHPYTVVRLDFTKTQKLYPGGTLVLLAYLELLLQEHPGRIRARCFPKSLAAQLLRHFGLADRLGINVADSQPTDDSVVNWRYLTGTGADGEKIADLLQSYKELTSVDPPEGLYDVLSEALINVRHHAYPEASNVPEAMRRWWLFARFNEPKNNRPGNLYIAIYDIGVGIQNSLRVRLQGSAESPRVSRRLQLWRMEP